MTDDSGAPSLPATDLEEELARLRLLYSIGLEFNSTLDFDELLPRIFDRVLSAVGAQGGSIWLAEGDQLRCKLAMGSASQKLVGTTMPVGQGFVGDVARKQRSTIVTHAIQDPRFEQRVDRTTGMMTLTVMACPMIAEGVTVGAIQVANKVTGDGIFDEHDRELLEGLASSAALALRNAQLHTAERRARDLALLLEISREITATLDLDRVLHSVVNLASRALAFDQAAVALYVSPRYEIRAIAGEEQVNPKDERTKRLTERAAWAAARGERFYLVDRNAPPTDPERTFVSAFQAGLEADGIESGLYLPLRDEEGPLGVLVFEARRPAFANETQMELAEILANQTAVALRNAQLYHQVPLVEALGALAARKRALMKLPLRRRVVYGAALAAGLAVTTLIRWPLRIDGHTPAFRASSYAEVRAVIPGIIERVLATEGMTVSRGAPLVQMRDVELRAARLSVAAEQASAERAASVAASRGDPAEERLQRARAQAFRQQVALRDAELAGTTLRAPVSGTVLTPRPEERVGARLEPGDPVLTLGRTDTLLLGLGVAQQDIARVRLGQEIRLRVDALPGRTFTGGVVGLGELPADSGSAVFFPVFAAVPNPESLLRPGMSAHARVLTAPTSLAGRLLRGPTRWLRLLWWRMRP
ncbi:MAG: GAF domain-containing protein [Gemmatimonadales bacterium]